LALVSAAAITLAAGGTTPQITLATTGAVTLTGALNGTSASLSSTLTATKGTFNGTTSEPIRIERFVSGSAVGRYSLSISSVGNFSLYDAIADSDRLIVNQSTGAATFSSSVTAGSWLNVPNTFGLTIRNAANTAFRTALQMNASNVLIFGQDTDITALTLGVGSEALRIASTGNVGIGTASPIDKLNVNAGGVTFTGSLSAPTNTSVGSLQIGYDGTQGIIRTWQSSPLLISTYNYQAFETNGTERMRITSGGVVLVNQTALSDANTGTKMQVACDMLVTGSLAGYFFENRSGGVTSNTNWYGWYATAGTVFLWNGSANAASINPSTGIYTPLSDENKKKDFEESTIGLNEVLNLKPTLYRMKDDESEGEKELGFIAQEVKEFIPQAYVEGGEEDAKFIGLNYNAIVAALVKSVQELKAEIDSLKTK
jgi:hypothetical protein